VRRATQRVNENNTKKKAPKGRRDKKWGLS
jgi:hypothetical protein